MKTFLDVLTLPSAVFGLIFAFFFPVGTIICGIVILIEAVVSLFSPGGLGFFISAVFFAVVGAIIALTSSLPAFLGSCLALCIGVLFLQVVAMLRKRV